MRRQTHDEDESQAVLDCPSYIVTVSLKSQSLIHRLAFDKRLAKQRIHGSCIDQIESRRKRAGPEHQAACI